MLYDVLILVIGLGSLIKWFNPIDGFHNATVSAGGMYGYNEYGTYSQGYVRGEVGVGPGFFPVVGGVQVGVPWIAGRQPYQFWIGLCSECYAKWIRDYADRLLGGRSQIRRYQMLMREVGRLDSLLSLVDTSALRYEMERRLSVGDTFAFDSLRRLYDNYILLSRRYSYAKGLLEKMPMDTSLLRVREDIMGIGSVLRDRGMLPNVTTFVERVRLLRIGRFQPTLMPQLLMFPMWLEGVENTFSVKDGLSVGFFGGRITTLPYGIDSVSRYWSGGVLLDIKGRYKLGGYGIYSGLERQYVGYLGVYGNVSNFVYDINVFRAMYERLGQSYILVREGVEDSVSGLWRSSHSGFWAMVGYGSKRVSVGLSGSYYGTGKLLLLPQVPRLIGKWQLVFRVKGGIWNPTVELGQIFMPSDKRYTIGLRVDVKGKRGRISTIYRSYLRDIIPSGTHIVILNGSYYGNISPNVFIKYQFHDGNLDVLGGGLSVSFATGTLSHALNGSYQVLRWLVPVEWTPVQRQYEGRYSVMLKLSSLALGPYLWYYSSEGGISGDRRHIVSGFQFSYSTKWGLTAVLWFGAGPYFTENSKIVRFDSGIQIGLRWERD